MAKKKSGVSVQPLGDRVLIKSVAEEEGERKLESGIILPGTVKDKGDSTKRGTVVAVGPGRVDDGERIPIGVSVGDTVLFSWGEEMQIDGEEYHLVNESNLLAVVK